MVNNLLICQNLSTDNKTLPKYCRIIVFFLLQASIVFIYLNFWVNNSHNTPLQIFIKCVCVTQTSIWKKSAMTHDNWIDVPSLNVSQKLHHCWQKICKKLTWHPWVLSIRHQINSIAVILSLLDVDNLFFHCLKTRFTVLCHSYTFNFSQIFPPIHFWILKSYYPFLSVQLHSKK